MTTATVALPHSSVTLGVKPKKGEPLPAPTCRLTDNPRGWALNKLRALPLSLVFGHVLLFAWVAVYFALFETQLLSPLVHLFGAKQDMKQWWDGLFSTQLHLMSQSTWDTWRHMFRDGGETYLVGMTVGFFTCNPYTHKFKPLHSLSAVAGRVVVSLLAVIPLFVIFGLGLHLLQYAVHGSFLNNDIGQHPSLAAKLYASSYATKIAIFAAGFIGRRPMIPVFVFVMEYFAEKRVAAGKGERPWHQAPYRAMLRLLGDCGPEHAAAKHEARSNWTVWLFSGGALALLALAVWGFTILNKS